MRAFNTLDLKNPFFRYTGQPPQPPPGCNETSPTDGYWQSLEQSPTGNSLCFSLASIEAFLLSHTMMVTMQ